MKTLLFLNIICWFITTFSTQKAKTIIVNTDKAIDINKISIYNNESDMYFNKKQLYPKLNVITKNSFRFSTTDSILFLLYEGCIAYTFHNIDKFQEDTIKLNNIKFIKYNLADTIKTTTTKYSGDSSIASIIKHTKVIQHKALHEIKAPSIIVNAKSFIGDVTIKPTSKITNSCRPNKDALETEWIGKDIRFEYLLTE